MAGTVSTPSQVFLGGACGTTTWRQRLAIPALRAAGVPFHDPQLPVGAWTPAHEPAEMAAKDRCDVLLWVIAADSRGVASVAEAAYYLAAGRKLALAMVDVPADARFDGRSIADTERDDLNRGRIFVRTMARLHGVPVWPTVEQAVQYAIELAQRPRWTAAALTRVLADVQFDHARFLVGADPEQAPWLQIEATVQDRTDVRTMSGRRWPIAADATVGEVVQTALKAALAWQEHETRERFRWRGQPVFSPHHEPGGLHAQCISQPRFHGGDAERA